jgi:hypothetical protein
MSAAIRRGPAEEGVLDPIPESFEVVLVRSSVAGELLTCALAGRWELDIPRPDNKRAAVARRESNIAFMPSEFLMYSLSLSICKTYIYIIGLGLNKGTSLAWAQRDLSFTGKWDHVYDLALT